MSSLHSMLPVLLALMAGAAPGASAEAAAKRRVLYFSQTMGGRHATIDLGRDVLRKLGAASGAFALDECTDSRKWSAEYFKPYDAIVSFGGGNLVIPEACRKALLAFVRGGKGFVGIHAAVVMLPQPAWPEFAQMLGAQYAGILWEQPVQITVEDRRHPATRHLGASFTIKDEIYQFARWERAKTHVLLSVDTRSVDVFKLGVRRKDRDFAVAWCHPYGRGRVFYTCLGHSPQTWQDPRFQTHLMNAIRWAMGELPAKVPLGSDGRIREVRRREAGGAAAAAVESSGATRPHLVRLFSANVECRTPNVQ